MTHDAGSFLMKEK